MNPDEAIGETVKDIFVDALPPQLRNAIKTHERNLRRAEQDNRRMQTQAQFMAYQRQTEATLQQLLEHSKSIQDKLDKEKEKREAAEKKANFWQILSLILGIISIVLAAIGLVPIILQFFR